MAPVREGHGTVSVCRAVRAADAALAFPREVLGARPVEPEMRDGAGRFMHVSIAIGDTMLMLGDPGPAAPERPAMVHVSVADCDATHAAALAAGAPEVAAPAEQDDRDRRPGGEDMAGNLWWIATAPGETR